MTGTVALSRSCKLSKNLPGRELAFSTTKTGFANHYTTQTRMACYVSKELPLPPRLCPRRGCPPQTYAFPQWTSAPTHGYHTLIVMKLTIKQCCVVDP
jgi:hypothetical protein